MKFTDPKSFDALVAEALDAFRLIATKPKRLIVQEGARFYTMSTMEASNTTPEEALLLEVVRSVVRHPDRVTISTTHGKEISVLTITVDPQDISHVIGREHRTIQAVRHILAKSAAMNGRKAIVNLDT